MHLSPSFRVRACVRACVFVCACVVVHVHALIMVHDQEVLSEQLVVML